MQYEIYFSFCLNILFYVLAESRTIIEPSVQPFFKAMKMVSTQIEWMCFARNLKVKSGLLEKS